MSTWTLIVSSKTDEKDRWTELQLERFSATEYIVEVRGCSDIVGEWDHAKSKECETAAEVIEALRAPGGGISNLALELLRQAAELDESFKELEEARADHPRRGGRGR